MTEQIIRDDFKNHVATFREWTDGKGAGATIEWANPKSGQYRITYLIHGYFLMVYGDCGEAIYSWPAPNCVDRLTLEWLADCELPYFAGKCRVLGNHDSSFPGHEWCRDEAAFGIRKRIAEALEDASNECRGRLVGVWDCEIDEASSSAIAAGQFGHAYDLQELWKVGYIISDTVRYHYYGLKMAHEQLVAKEPVAACPKP